MAKKPRLGSDYALKMRHRYAEKVKPNNVYSRKGFHIEDEMSSELENSGESNKFMDGPLFERRVWDLFKMLLIQKQREYKSFRKVNPVDGHGKFDPHFFWEDIADSERRVIRHVLSEASDIVEIYDGFLTDYLEEAQERKK